MAEIFSAVASGAGLVSLSMQLLESSQKLKNFYNASRDAPQTVADLSFELETMSLSLRQLVIHRQADISSDTLLGRCIVTCTLMTAKIVAAVDKMDHALRRSRGIGRMYSAFKEPEISKLLEGLEHAKSSMLFAYMSYCQSWNLREATLRAAEAQAQNALLSSHEAQLQNLSLAVQSGHATILERIETTRLSGSITSSGGTTLDYHTRQSHSLRNRGKRPSTRTFRLALPHWLSRCVWEFAAHELDGAWNFTVRPINIRPYGTFAFDVVRSGNVEDVRKLLSLGELSVSDHESLAYEPRPRSLLFVAARFGHLELCEFLLREFPTYYSETDLHQVLTGFLRRHQHYSFHDLGQERVHKLVTTFYTLFLKTYGTSVDLYKLVDKPVKTLLRDHQQYHLTDIGSNMLLTDEAVHELIMGQTIPFDRWNPTDRFCAAVNARGWSAGAFVRLIGAESDVQLAQWTDHRGKTALHWAAEHFGYWSSLTAVDTSRRYGEGLRQEYGELCTMLITQGADPNALDLENWTPLTYLLRATHASVSFDPWREDVLCDAVAQWGQCIQNAGLPLHDYVVAENDLQSRLGSAASNLRVYDKGSPWAYRLVWTCRLVIAENLTLAIEVGFSAERPLWQYCPPPGTWRRDKYPLEKIGWSPESYFEGDDWILWQQAASSNVNLPPTLICPDRASFSEQSTVCAWREWATGVQDDHGFVCMTLQRRPGASRERGRVRRTTSLPPPMITRDSTWEPNDQRLIFQARMDPWMSDSHWCPLDLTWKSTYCAANDCWGSRRRCMLGRCDDGEPYLLYSRHWEVKLLDDESNLEIARRFTDRFKPEWRHIVEENHIRRQRRAELGMSAASMP